MQIALILGCLWLAACVALYASGYRVRHSTAYGAPVAPRRLSSPGVSGSAQRRFLAKLFALAFLARLLAVFLINATGAIRNLGLSTDSLRYHREGILISHEMQNGFFNWPNWIDNGWFQFTGLVYYLFGPHYQLIQLFNITLGALTPIIVYWLVQRTYGNEWLARTTAILVGFFPSFIYWSSLMLKDPVSILAMSLLALSVVQLRVGFRLRWVLAMCLALLVFLSVREYLFFVCILLIPVSFLPVQGSRSGPLLLRLTLITVVVGIATHLAGFGFLGSDYILRSEYFDLDYINSTRIKIGDHGTGAFFSNPGSALWGEGLGSTLKAILAAIYFFFVTLDFTQIGSTRQLMALPEVLLTIILLPSFFRGLVYSWRQHRQRALPLMIFSFGILVVYGAATTNMGAMYRWRMQAMPFILTFMIVGLAIRQRGVIYQFLRKISG